MNLLVTGAWKSALECIDAIKYRGHSVVYLQHEQDEVPSKYSWVEGVIGNRIFLTHPIERFTHLKFVQLTGAGYDHIPMSYIKKNNIKIYNARGVYSIPMAEYAVCGTLQLYKKMCYFYKNKVSHKWDKNRNLQELDGKNVAIVGCGSVGTECAKRFRAFGCNIMGVDIVKVDGNYFNSTFLIDSLDDLLEIIDVLILTVPLTSETHWLINEYELKKMKSDAIIINISRGGVINTNALIQALDRLGGAVLDVFEEEPLEVTSPLWTKENVIITPHNSFVGENNEKRLAKLIIDNLDLTIQAEENHEYE